MPVSETEKVTTGFWVWGVGIWRAWGRLRLGLAGMGCWGGRGRSEVGLAGIGAVDAGRLGLELAGIGSLKPAPTAGGLVGAGFQASICSGPNPNLPASSASRAQPWRT